MKKFIYPILGLSVLFASCDMDLEMDGVLNEKEALSSFDNMEYYRNGLYQSMLGATGGANVSYSAIQGDEFIGVIINGNRLGSINNGNIFSSTTDITGFFGSKYSTIASINYYIPKAEAMAEVGLDSDEELAQIRRFIAESKFMRAYNYWFLTAHFCQDYSTAIGDEPGLGMPLVSVYNPTPLTSVYPGRSTLNETYAFIEKDLEDSYNGLLEFEEDYPAIANSEMLINNPAYLNHYAVRALQARIALFKGEWQKAYDYADEIVSSKRYNLTALRAYGTMWTADTGTELIFRPFCDRNEQAACPSTGGAWISAVINACDYIPTQNLLDIYEDTDCRKTAFFGSREINVLGLMVNVPIFIKYPGNSQLNLIADQNALKNIPKPFRTAEMVLIMAEAAAKLGNIDDANDALRQIRTARISKYTQPNNYSGDELTYEIRLERQRELVGEGFRLLDLRRWGLGFTRNTNYVDYPDAESVTVVAGRSVVYDENDHRYVWPIPVREFQTNPQIAGQQNPGY